MTEMQFRMIEDNLDIDLISEKTINIIDGWLKENQIQQNEVQKEMLLSHVTAMVSRAKTLEKLPGVDPLMFSELSDQSMLLAQKTINLFNNLPIEEAYLLAIHYEVALNNE